MPTYEYRCTECGAEFERVQKMNDAHISECPECQGEVRRLISKGGGILFKGTGFYATDYRSGGPSSESKKSESSSSESEKSESSSSESKKSESGSSAGKSADASGNGSTGE